MELVTLLRVHNVYQSRGDKPGASYDQISAIVQQAPDEDGVEELQIASGQVLAFKITQPDIMGKLKVGSTLRVTLEVEDVDAEDKAQAKHMVNATGVVEEETVNA